MALVRLGPMVQAASGRIGALCFSHQGGSPIVRTQPLPRARTSQLQLETRAAFSRARAAWTTLSDADRLTWTRAAAQLTTPNRLGLARQVSGYNQFLALALPTILAGNSPPTSPASLAISDIPAIATIQIWPSGPAVLAFTQPYTITYPNVAVQAQRLVSLHPGLPGQLWRNIYRGTVNTQAVNIWDPLVAAFGTPQSLEWYRFQVTQSISAWPRTFTTRSLVQIPDVGPELITNGDFQTGGTPPSGWAVSGTGQLTQDDWQPYADGWSGYWAVGDGQPITYTTTAWAKRFSLISGAAYTCRFAHWGYVGNITNMYVLAAGMTSIKLCDALPTSSYAWLTQEYHFTPDSTTSNAILRIYNYTDTPCEHWFDNISIRKDTP